MDKLHDSTLALLGGSPLHTAEWPKWPRQTESTAGLLNDVLNSGRWAISGPFTGLPCFEKQFSEAFAKYHDVPYAVPTSNGTSALTIAMESLGVGAGDEIIVPGLTWVACASAAAGIGSIPILVDIDPDTLSISKDATRAAITDKTKAFVIVHAYCSCANIEGFLQLSEETGIPIIEDCSQAHGAEWNGRKVGTFGQVAIFSLQQVKVLTCGEGGIAITHSPELYDKMQQLRADGRRYLNQAIVGELELEEVGSIQGRNYCLSEFHAAVALSQLAYLDEWNEIRSRNAEFLSELLQEIPGISTISVPPQVTKRTYFQYVVRLQRDVLGTFSIHKVIEALKAELNILVEMLDTPLNNNTLYNPLSSPRTAKAEQVRKQLDPRRFDLPIATQVQQSSVAIAHWGLLGNEEDMTAIASAFKKIVANIQSLR